MAEDNILSGEIGSIQVNSPQIPYKTISRYVGRQKYWTNHFFFFLPMLPAVELWILNHWTGREVPPYTFIMMLKITSLVLWQVSWQFWDWPWRAKGGQWPSSWKFPSFPGNSNTIIFMCIRMFSQSNPYICNIL